MIDPDAKRLAMAIRQQESGGNYEAKGQSGEYGAYQFMPETWKSSAKQVLGDANAKPTRENQNKVAYTKIKTWKDQGYKPDQIASLWNHGKPEYQGVVGTNKQGVHYDTPSYVKNVYSHYNKLKQEEGALNARKQRVDTANVRATQGSTPGVPDQPSQFSKDHPILSGIGGFFGDIAKGIAEPVVKTGVTGLAAIQSAGQLAMGNQAGAEKTLSEGYNVPFFGQVKPAKIGTDVEQQKKGELGFGRNTLETFGTGAQLASNFVGAEGAGAIAGDTAKGLIGSAVKRGAMTGAETGFLGGLGSGLRDPNATSGSVAGQTALGTAGGAILGGALGPMAARSTAGGRGAILDKELSDFVAPVLSKAEKEAAVSSRRVVPGGLLRTPKVIASEREKAMADAVKGIVDPTKSHIEGANKVFDAITNEATDLVQRIKAKDVSYNNNLLKSVLRKVEKPLALKGDVEKMYQEAEGKFLEFANKQPKTASGLLQARKEFDQWIEQQVPKIWDDPRFNALHQALRDMRGQANEFISSRVPDANVQASLAKQSLMYKVKDNLAEKAAKEELGLTGLQSKVGRLTKKYPISTGIGSALIGGKAYEEGKKLLGL